MTSATSSGDDGTLAYPVPIAAKLIGIGTTLAWELVRSGQLGSIRVNRRVVVPRQSLEEFLRQRLDGASS